MPIPGAKYRYKKGTSTRLAFEGGEVVEAKNMDTGATHTPAEFAEDRRKMRPRRPQARKGKMGAYEPLAPKVGSSGLMEG